MNDREFQARVEALRFVAEWERSAGGDVYVSDSNREQKFLLALSLLLPDRLASAPTTSPEPRLVPGEDFRIMDSTRVDVDASDMERTQFIPRAKIDELVRHADEIGTLGRLRSLFRDE